MMSFISKTWAVITWLLSRAARALSGDDRGSLLCLQIRCYVRKIF